MIPFPSWSMMPTSSLNIVLKCNPQAHFPTFISVSEAFHPKSVMTWIVQLFDISVSLSLSQYYVPGPGRRLWWCRHRRYQTVWTPPGKDLITASSSHSLATGRVEIVSLSILHVSWILDADGSLVILNLSLRQALSGLGKKITAWRRFNVQYRISWFSARLTALISSSLRFCSSI